MTSQVQSKIYKVDQKLFRKNFQKVDEAFLASFATGSLFLITFFDKALSAFNVGCVTCLDSSWDILIYFGRFIGYSFLLFLCSIVIYRGFYSVFGRILAENKFKIEIELQQNKIILLKAGKPIRMIRQGNIKKITSGGFGGLVVWSTNIMHEIIIPNDIEHFKEIRVKLNSWVPLTKVKPLFGFKFYLSLFLFVPICFLFLLATDGWLISLSAYIFSCYYALIEWDYQVYHKHFGWVLNLFRLGFTFYFLSSLLIYFQN
ncbi:MAG: hypothetical protein FVQ83_15295 [Chloroflexi bacterium]|nr:hypothetical protein [Chloroflexota bacterium]